jgi:hypothetical protein
MAPRFFCPGCWMEIGEKVDRCPHCGYALKDFQGLSYDYVRKLGTDRAVCIGNGRNDRLMVGEAAVGKPAKACGDLACLNSRNAGSRISTGPRTAKGKKIGIYL